MERDDDRERFEREVVSQRAARARLAENGRRSFSLWVWLQTRLTRATRPN